jgi:hypothetical protein
VPGSLALDANGGAAKNGDGKSGESAEIQSHAVSIPSRLRIRSHESAPPTRTP